MSSSSTIEWTDSTWNPVRGCTKISPGCAHCYASTFAERFRGVRNHPYEQGFDLRLVEKKLYDPLRWGRARRVFVNSMSDLFHKDIEAAYISRVVDVMRITPWHTYQVLTKRATRLRELASSSLSELRKNDHIWWGVSVEDKRHGLQRIEELRQAAVGLKFLSVEPLLEDLGKLDLADISWVIVGGESGPRARSMNADWVRSIRQQCLDVDVPFFFKQWGGTQKKRTGRILDGITHDAVPPLTSRKVPAIKDREALILQLEERWRVRRDVNVLDIA